MKLKTYTARSLAQALAAVKHTLGSDAVILHTRTYKRGGIWGLGARSMVEVTAAEGREYRQALRAKAAAQARRAAPAASPSGRAAPVSAPTPPAPGHTAGGPAAGDLIKRTYAAAQAAMAHRAAQGTCVSPEPSLLEAVNSSQAAAPPTLTPLGGHAAELTREMQAVKRLMARMIHQGRDVPKRGDPAVTGTDPLFDEYLALLEQEVSQELADELIRKVHGALEPGHVDDDSAVRAAIRRELAALIPAVGGELTVAPTTDGRPRIMAFVGPTGVGKTTTVAKLAAQFKLKHKQRVGLITLDTYRIAAVDQLQTYANIIGVPLRVVSTPPEVMDALRFFRDCQVVLVDTAGRSQRDDGKLEQLDTLIRAARPHEVHLVLCATCSQPALMDTVQRFSRVRIDNIVLTKLDEAVSFGVLVNIARNVNKRLSYVTTGQEVPHDIETGRADRLAGLLLGEGLK